METPKRETWRFRTNFQISAITSFSRDRLDPGKFPGDFRSGGDDGIGDAEDGVTGESRGDGGGIIGGAVRTESGHGEGVVEVVVDAIAFLSQFGGVVTVGGDAFESVEDGEFQGEGLRVADSRADEAVFGIFPLLHQGLAIASGLELRYVRPVAGGASRCCRVSRQRTASRM